MAWHGLILHTGSLVNQTPSTRPRAFYMLWTGGVWFTLVLFASQDCALFLTPMAISMCIAKVCACTYVFATVL